MIKMINIAMCPINASEKSFFILTIIIISVPFLLIPQLCNRVTLEIRLDSEIIIKKAVSITKQPFFTNKTDINA